MARGRQILVAGGTFSVALGIGFVMQNGDALAGYFSPEDTQHSIAAQPLATPDDTGAGVIVADGAGIASEQDAGLQEALATPMAEDAPATTMTLAAVDAVLDDLPMLDVPAMEMPVFDPAEMTDEVATLQCDAAMSATTGAGGMVQLVLDAPCAPDAAVVIHHQGMMFTILTDMAGQATVTVPALAEVSVFVAAFNDGSGAAATAMVPDLAAIDRAVLQWQGEEGLQLHAFEFGANYGDAGHVWAGAPREASAGADGGFLIRLGDPAAVNPLIAEVYSFPSGQSPRGGAISLSVEAEVTEANCGREIAAQSLQIAPGEAPSALDLTMTMPGCDALGEFLVLHGMLHDLQLAENEGQ